MKTRNGFVSNSSSTSFTFCYKGDGVKPLTDLILNKYRNQFSRSYDEWHCNALDVINAIERCFNSKSEFNCVQCNTIDKIILDAQAYLDRIKQDIKEEEAKKDNGWLLQNALEHKQETELKIQKLNAIKERGLTTVLVIDFGDNHGEVQGGYIGYAMDYDGRYIDINSNDLVVFTELNR